MKNFLIWWITFTRWDEIIFLFTPYYKGNFWSLVFWYTFSVPLQVKYFVIRKGRKKESIIGNTEYSGVGKLLSNVKN